MTKRSKPDWRTVRFGDVVRNVNSVERKPLENGIERFVGLDHLDRESLHIKRWGLVADGTTFTRKFVRGQVLFGKRRAYQHKAAVAEFDGICSGDILVFESANDELLPELLPFIVQSDGFFERALGTSAGSLSPRTKWKDLAAYEFALPPRDEQRRIAEILWAADEAVEKHLVVAEAMRALINTFRAEKFGSTNHQVRLAELCESKGIQIGPFGSQLHASDYVANGVPVIMPTDMTDDYVREDSISKISPKKAQSLSSHKVIAGDILLPRRGELDRRAFIRSEQVGWLCGTGSLRVRVKSTVPARAVFHALAAPQTVKWLREHAVGTTMPNLNATIVSNIPICLPRDQEIQSVLQTIDNAIYALEQVENKIAILHKLKSTLLNSEFGTATGG